MADITIARKKEVLSGDFGFLEVKPEYIYAAGGFLATAALIVIIKKRKKKRRKK